MQAIIVCQGQFHGGEILPPRYRQGAPHLGYLIIIFCEVTLAKTLADLSSQNKPVWLC